MHLNKLNLAFFSTLRELKAFWRGFFEHTHDHFIPHHRNNYQPHMLSGRALALFSALLITARLTSLATASFDLTGSEKIAEISSQNIISLTNEARKSFGLQKLTESPVLNVAAKAKAEDMLSKGYFAHNSPEGKTPWQFLELAGYNYFAAGENLAINFTDADSLENAWMNSPSHKANILKSDFEEIGIGMARGEYHNKPATFVVQMFGVPSEQKIKLLSSPTSVERADVPMPVNGEIFVKANSKILVSAEILPALGNRVKVKVQTIGDAVKVLANFGNRAVMLNPKPGNFWEAYVDVEKLVNSNAQLKLSVLDINSQSQNINLASFSSELISGQSVLGASTFANMSSDSATATTGAQNQQMYLWFALVMLSCLILAIAIHPKIQHTGMIANGSLVVILAIILWSTG